MLALFNGVGFLGTSAPFRSDLSLLLIITSAILLTIGWRLAVAKHFEIHRWIQTTAVIVNTLAVATVMIPAFVSFILPGIPGRLLEGSYGVTTIHAIIGAIGLILGIFIVLRANGLMPAALRFRNYKAFMRTSYSIYMLSTVIGVVVYIVVYVYHI